MPSKRSTVAPQKQPRDGRKSAPAKPAPSEPNADPAAMTSRFNPDADLIRRLAEVINETGLTEIEYAEGDRRIRVARSLSAQNVVMQGTAPIAAQSGGAAAAAAAPAAGADMPANAVVSPMVGTAYLSPEPGAAPFARPGDRVGEGQTLLIIEAMKVMNPIKSPRAGTVKAVLIQNAEPVEYGQPLIVVE
jgi:acetyl-CoA carboxylase biotin carboxyl carrier protein